MDGLRIIGDREMRRLPIIRHIRAAIFAYRCNRHYEKWRAAGFIGGWTEAEDRHWKAILRGDV